MKIVCHRDGFHTACQLVAAAAASKDVKPVLRNLKASVQDDRCSLSATDLEIGMRLEVRGLRVLEAGEGLLPPRVLTILREVSDDELTISAGPDSCKIQGATTEFDMPGEDPGTFPDVPVFSGEKYHQMTAGVLREMIRRTLFAAGEQTRYGATVGVLWELEKNEVVLVGTDGRRLAQAKGAAEAHGGHTTKGATPVVPIKAMAILERNLSEADEAVKIAFRPNEVLMKTERAMVYSRLVEGRFPNYKQALPTKHEARVPLVVGPFLSAVRQAAIMTDDETKRVRFTFEKRKLTLRAQGGETGASRVELPIDFDGKKLEIAFDPRYLVDMLKVLEPDTTLQLDLQDGEKPAMFRHDPNYLYVVVPLVETKPAAPAKKKEPVETE